eukprot:2559853-Rhodomonas_salina.2
MLDHNSIQILSSTAFNGLTALHFLDLSWNFMETIKFGAFKELARCDVLCCLPPRYSMLGTDAAYGASLEWLLIHANSLTRLDPGQLLHLSSASAMRCRVLACPTCALCFRC